MNNISKITTRAVIQYIMVVGVVVLVGIGMRFKGEKPTSFTNPDSLVSTTPISESQEIGQNSEKSSGHKIVYGNAEASNGKLYPFRVEFDEYDGKIVKAIYYNPDYSTKVNFDSAGIVEGEYVFRGKIGKEEFLLKFSAQRPYVGILRQGNSSLKAIMDL